MRPPMFPLAAILGMLAALACGTGQAPAPLTEAERLALADTVRQSVRDYFLAADSIPCERPDSLIDQTMTFGYGPFVSVGDTTIIAAGRDSALVLMRMRPCPSPVKDARLVGAIEVQLLTRDHAVVAWRFDEEMREPDGLHQRVQGAVLETKVRTPTGWRSSSGMGSHVKVGAPRRLPE